MALITLRAHCIAQGLNYESTSSKIHDKKYVPFIYIENRRAKLTRILVDTEATPLPAPPPPPPVPTGPGVMTLHVFCKTHNYKYHSVMKGLSLGRKMPFEVFRVGRHWYIDKNKRISFPPVQPTLREWARQHGLNPLRFVQRWTEGRVHGLECEVRGGTLYVVKESTVVVDETKKDQVSRGMVPASMMQDAMPEGGRHYEHFFWCIACQKCTVKFIPDQYAVAGVELLCKTCGTLIGEPACPSE